MKRELTNEEALKILEGLTKFRDSDIEIPIEVGYRIIQNIKSLKDALEPYEEARIQTIQKYSDDGESVEPKSKNYKFCRRDINTLLRIAIDVDVNEIAWSAIKNIKAPMNCVNALMFMTEKPSGDAQEEINPNE